ncbi:MAG: ribulose bisphosphate carboxylase small subunit [Pseudanabaenaceae cyanobacterium]
MIGTGAERGLTPVKGPLPLLTMGNGPSLAALVASGTVRVGAGTVLGPAAVVVPQGAVTGFPTGNWPAKVLGDDGREYAAWLGSGVGIAHLALICGPVYLGDRVFVGFRATVFNARIGADCTIGAHALVCDVEVPAGRAVPPGAIVTSQAQADRLPLVSAAETALAQYVTTVLLGSETAAEPPLERLTVSDSGAPGPIPAAPHTTPVTATTMATTMATTQVSVEDVVRQFLAQGYRIGVEYADERRYRMGSWHSCATVVAASEREALAAVGACAAEHTGCYVRVFGIDAQTKRRVGEFMVQRPQAPFVPGQEVRGYQPVAGGTATRATAGGGSVPGSIDPVALNYIRQWLSAGYKLGTEHADERRFRTSSWHTCAPIAATSEAGAIAALEACMAEHQGEYVRLFGIDPKGKRRVAEVMLQRPGDAPPPSTGSVAVANGARSGPMAAGVNDTVRQWLAAGHKIVAEHADERRFRIGSWHGCAPIEAVTEANVLAALANCIAEHPGEYVRLVAVDPKAKRRVAEVMVQRPNGAGASPSAPTSTSAPTTAASTVAAAGSPAAQPEDGEVARQVREWLMAGHKIAMEYADARRFRIGSWQSCPPVTATTEAGVMAALRAYRQQYGGQYLRVVGINAISKQRVGDRIVQRAG